ncbi:MAG: hypothetical protein QOF58_270 [Pseudonocardiales bacterium]|jgi:hypothetical protein|nr:hypothetical protein [Pseudonocardiales bacterium]
MNAIAIPQVSGQVTGMNAIPDDAAGGLAVTVDITTDDGATTTVLLRIDADGVAHLRNSIDDATPIPAALAHGTGLDNRAFCTELVWADTDNPEWKQKAGWSLYFDSELVAHTADPLAPDAATAWADKRLAVLTANTTWLQGHDFGTYYRIPRATPALAA